MSILISILIILAVLFCIYLFLIHPNTPKMEVIDAFKKKKYFAHRGLYDNAGDAPENSLKAFQKAVDHGYGMEMDVQLSKDGIPVVFHDFVLSRVARNADNEPVPGKVCDYTLAQLQSFHLMDSTEKIPTFAQFLELLHGQQPVIVELKIENSDKQLAVCPKADDLLSRYQGLYCIESFNPRGVKWYKEHRPEVMRGQLSSMFTKTNEDRKKYWFIYLLAQNLMMNFLTAPDFIAYDALYWQNASRRICHKLFGNTAVAWTIRSQQQLEERRKDFDIFIFEHFEADQTK